MKADGLEYDERMALLEEITWPQPLRELLEALYETYRQTHPWLPDDALSPKSIVREMWEHGMGFTDFVGRYQLARSEGLVLRYLTDAYRTLRQLGARAAPRARGRGRHRVAGGDGAPDRLLAPRRVGGPVGPRPRLQRGRAPRAAAPAAAAVEARSARSG